MDLKSQQECALFSIEQLEDDMKPWHQIIDINVPASLDDDMKSIIQYYGYILHTQRRWC